VSIKLIKSNQLPHRLSRCFIQTKKVLRFLRRVVPDDSLKV